MFVEVYKFSPLLLREEGPPVLYIGIIVLLACTAIVFSELKSKLKLTNFIILSICLTSYVLGYRYWIDFKLEQYELADIVTLEGSVNHIKKHNELSTVYIEGQPFILGNGSSFCFSEDNILTEQTFVKVSYYNLEGNYSDPFANCIVELAIKH